ncbi:MAG: RagB/SusD family nutrient uptake outer membrane protein [Planctomycetota bacterium]|jgi:hypothetical protein
MKTLTKHGSRLLVVTLVLGGAACSLDSLLDVDHPGTVTPDDVQGRPGADLLWAGALGSFAEAFSSRRVGATLAVGLFTDELHSSGTSFTASDSRKVGPGSFANDWLYAWLHTARVSAEVATEMLADIDPEDGRIAELQGLAGFAYVLFGEIYCSGVPYGSMDPRSATVTFGRQATTEETWAMALERFDAAATQPNASADHLSLASLGRARVLLNRGEYAAAAQAVAAIPTDWEYLIHSADEAVPNGIYERTRDGNVSLSDREGENGVAFRSLNDARVPWIDAGGPGRDGSTPLYEQRRFDSPNDDIPLGNGIEARLIEAEASLAIGDAAGMLGTLNELRGTLGLDALDDPGTADARIDLLFQERALWLFGTAHRLGDLRRLVRQYGRAAESVFPTGAYFRGGLYGTDVSFPVTEAEETNPHFEGCFDRGA